MINLITFSFNSLSLFIALFLVWRDARKQGFSEEKLFDLILAGGMVALIGGRLSFVVNNWYIFNENWLRIMLFIKYPGFSLLGTFVFGLVGLATLARIYKFSVLKTLDLFALPLGVAMMVTMAGCYISRCVALPNNWEWIIVTMSWLLVVFLIILLRSWFNSSAYMAKVKRKDGILFVFMTIAFEVLTIFLIAKPIKTEIYWVLVIGLVLQFFAGVVYYREFFAMIVFPQKILTQIKEYLQSNLSDTEKRFNQLKKEDPTADKDHMHESMTDDDEAVARSQHTRVQVLQDQLSRTMIQIRRALTKIKIGRYGVCESCGTMIDTDRLAAMPSATLCLDCEKKKEKSGSRR